MTDSQPKADKLDRTFDKFSSIMFYIGASLLLMFIVWIEMAPLQGTPRWWVSGMTDALAIGVVALLAAITLEFYQLGRLYYDR